METGLKIPLFINGGLLLVLVFQAGIGWARLDNLQQEVVALRNQVYQAQNLKPQTAERLAKIEEGIQYLRADMNNLRSEIHGQRDK